MLADLWFDFWNESDWVPPAPTGAFEATIFFGVVPDTTISINPTLGGAN